MEDIAFKKLASWAILYAVLVSFLYLFGYWGEFEINIMEFAGFQDLARISVYPLIGAFLSVLVGVSISKLLSFEKLPPGGGGGSRFGRIVRKHWRLLVTLNIVLIIGIIHFFSSQSKWLIVAILVSFLSIPLSHLDLFISIIPNPKTRSTTLFLLMLLGGVAFAHGKLESELIKTRGSRQIIDIKRSKLRLKSDDHNPVSYIGYVSGYFFLYESATKNTVFIKANDFNHIFFYRNKNRI